MGWQLWEIRPKVLLSLRWNSHPVLSKSGGSPSVLPLVDKPPPQQVAVSESEISGRLGCFIFGHPPWCEPRVDRSSQTLGPEGRAIFSHSTAGPISVRSSWRSVDRSWGDRGKKNRNRRLTAGRFHTQCAAPFPPPLPPSASRVR